MRSVLASLFVICAFALSSYSQANSIKEMFFVFDRTSGYDSAVTILGDNINVTAKFASQTAPMFCAPCTPNSQINFGPALDNNGIIAASGTIDGIFYQNLYVQTSLSYSSPGPVRIPRVWSKSVRVSSPLVLTGKVGIWRLPNEVGNDAIVLYLHNGMNFTGRADLMLRSSFQPVRLVTDRSLRLHFQATSGKR